MNSGDTLLRRHRSSMDNIKMKLKGTGCENVDSDRNVRHCYNKSL